MRKSIWKSLVSMLFAVIMVFLSAEPQTVFAKTIAPLKAHGKLSVEGTHMVDENGDIVQLKGISTHGLSWFGQYANKKAFKTLRDKWGVEVVRLALYTENYNGYCNCSEEYQEHLLSLVKKAVRYATELDMYVIIDWHILSDGNPNIHKEEAKQFFKKMAKKYEDYDNVIYEICNEPNSGCDWNSIKSYAESVIKVIRTYDSDGIVIVGTPTWSQDVDVVAENPITKYDNLMYALHYYANTHTDWLRQRAQRAIDKGLPIYVSEYSVCDSSGDGWVNEAEANRWMDFLDENQIGSCFWSLSNKPEAASMIKSDCNKLSGWKASDLTTAGKWYVRMMKQR